MNWEAIGATGEVAGAIAVVVTLFYLASQIRQNTNALKADSRRASLESGHTVLFAIVNEPELVLDVISDEILEKEARVRLSAYLFAALRNAEFAWGQFREGAIDPAQWETESGVIRFLFDSQRPRDWWQHIGRNVFSSGFVVYVDSQLELHGVTETMWQGYVYWAEGKDA